MLLFETLNSAAKFKQIAILICHLLIGGKFQTAKIYFNSETFDDNFFLEIHSKCLTKIPIMTIDINGPEVPDWGEKVKPDHFIQLVFVDTDLTRFSLLFEQPSNYYRLFVFESDETVSTKPKFSNKAKFNPKSNSVGLFYNKTGGIEAHLLHDNLAIFNKQIDLPNLNEPINSEQLFDQIFGEREQMRKLGVLDANIYCERPLPIRTHLDLYDRAIRKYYFKQMEMDFYEMGSARCPLDNGRYFRPVPNRIYEELEWDLEPIDNDNGTHGTELFQNDSNIFFVNEFSRNNQNSTKSNITAISTVSVSKVRFVFVYEKSHQPMAPLNVSVILGTVWIQILFVGCATIMLYFLRHGDLVRRVDFISTFIDVMTAVIGGGTLRYRDKLEKIFFGFLFFGAFFINAIGLDNFLFATFLTQVPERIDTFEKMARYNPPVFKFDLADDDPIVQNISKMLGPSVDIKNAIVLDMFRNLYFALIADENFLAVAENYYEPLGYDYDIFPDSFGEVHHHNYLSYDTLIPRNLTKRFERATQALMESGLERFYWTVAKLKARVIFGNVAGNEIEEEITTLGFDQLFIFFVIFAIQMAFAVVVFIIELITHRMKITGRLNLN